MPTTLLGSSHSGPPPRGMPLQDKFVGLWRIVPAIIKAVTSVIYHPCGEGAIVFSSVRL